MRTQQFPVLRPISYETLARLSKDFGVPLPVAEWLWRRGIDSGAAWQDLTQDTTISSPYLLPDMARAVDVIERAIASQRAIRIHGDYDADGVTATAIMVRGLKRLWPSATVDFHIPNRFDEGYGLSEEAVRQAAHDGIHLLITVDCGSSSQKAAALAKELHVQLVITDHHGLSTPLPMAEALVNPERMATPNRFSGAGVALQLIRALAESKSTPMGDDLIAIAAIGTVADVVPLVGDNRRLVRYGLRLLREGHNPGVSAMVERSGRSLSHLEASDLGFYIGPRLNAIGRMHDATPAVLLLLAEDKPSLDPLIDALEQANQERRTIERDLLSQAEAQLSEWQQTRRPLPPFVVVGGDGWHPGVIGIVASRLKERLRSPVAVVGWEGASGKGSARGVEGLNLLAHLRQSADAFEALGGHRGAAGFSLARQSLPDLAVRLSRGLPLLVQTQRYWGAPIDGCYPAEDLTPEVFDWLERLQPTGHGFAAPRWLVRGRAERLREMGQAREHLRFHFSKATWPSVAFHFGHHRARIATEQPIWAAGQVTWNVFRNQRQVQFVADTLITPPLTEAWPKQLQMQKAPENLIGLKLLVVDSQQQLGALERQGVTCYDWTQPMAERAVLDYGIRSRLLEVVAFCQWRPWPEWIGTADHVIWLCRPLVPQAIGWSSALLSGSGQQWLDPEFLSRSPSPIKKWQRLVPDRERLGYLWQLKRKGITPLLPGAHVFKELGLDPDRPMPATRLDLMDSPSYHHAWTLRVAAESEIDWAAQISAVGRTTDNEVDPITARST